MRPLKEKVVALNTTVFAEIIPVIERVQPSRTALEKNERELIFSAIQWINRLGKNVHEFKRLVDAALRERMQGIATQIRKRLNNDDRVFCFLRQLVGLLKRCETIDEKNREQMLKFCRLAASS